MSKDFSVNVSTPNQMYDAFKRLTTDRAQNRGTIEVVKNGNGVVTLKCAQHHFYSSSVVLPNKDLNDALTQAVGEALEIIGDKKLLELYDEAGTDKTQTSAKADKLNTLLTKLRSNMIAGINLEKGTPEKETPTIRPLTREAIKNIINQVEFVKTLSVDQLLEIGADAFADPKALQDRINEINIRKAAKTCIKDFEESPIELGHRGRAELARAIFDPQRCIDAAQKDMKIETCQVSDDIGSEDLVCKENPFSSMAGGTAEIVQTIARENSNAQICTQIAADATHWGCGVFVPWNTQEESTVKNADPELGAHLMGKGLIKPEIFGEQLRMRYTQGPNHLSTVAGWMTHTKYAGVEKSDLLFSSLPTFGNTFESWDLDGNTDFSCRVHQRRRGVEPTDAERANVRACNDALYQKYGDDKNDVSDEQFKEAAYLLMCGDFDTLHGDPDTVVESVIKLVKSGEHKTVDATTGRSPLDKAKAVYEDTVRQSVRAWIATARKRGDTHFVGMAVGCQTFKNDTDVVAKIIAEEFVIGGGNMKYVYANYLGMDFRAAIFEEAFKTAWGNREQLRANAAANAVA